MKVKIFDCAETKTLEKEINDFIENTKNIEVIDIKYTTADKKCYNAYSALVMYKYQLVMDTSNEPILTEDDLKRAIQNSNRAIDR